MTWEGMETPDGTRTEQSHWDAHWEALTLPAERRREPGDVYRNAILDILDRHAPKDPTLPTAESVGVPGQCLARGQDLKGGARPWER